MKLKFFSMVFLALCLAMFGCTNIFEGNGDNNEAKEGDPDDAEPGLGAAPNIYLYPEVAGNISVKLEFADENSFFTNTDPEYDEGWNVWVEPDGLIDGAYDYLYYAGELLSRFQKIEGWAVEEDGVFEWFEKTMRQMGFNQNETDDFIVFITQILILI